MKILFNTIVTPAQSKIGVGVYIDNLLPQLITAYPQHTFYSLVNEQAPAFVYDATNHVSISSKASPSPSVRLLLYQRAFMRISERMGADLYHLPNTAPLALNKSIPTIANIMDLQEFRIQKYGRIRGWYRRSANYLLTRNADIIITISENSKKDIVNFLGISPDKVCVTYLAHSQVFRKLDTDTAQGIVYNKYNLNDYMIAVGDIAEGKNLLRLVEMYAMLRKNGETRPLVLVGKEPQPFPELHDYIQEHSLHDFVQFTGYVPLSDLVALYNCATLCLFPSLYEGFGLPVLEAMACGTPVATSNVSSIPEVAGDAAVLFDPLDVEDMFRKVKPLLDNPSYRAKMVERGYQQANLFTWKRAAAQTMAVYEEAASMTKAR
ncbi:MAG: glycosyltransferase family 1 protein [Chloroflexota bacterium]